LGHDSFIYRTWLIHTWDMTHSYMGHDSFIRGTWLILSHTHMNNSCHTWDMTHSFAPAIIVVCIRTHFYSHIGHDSFICWTWLIHTCDMTHLHHQPCPEYHGVYTHALLFARGTWIIHTWDMTHCLLPAIARIIILCSRPSIHKWLIHTWDMTHLYVGHDSFICGTWLIASYQP